MERELETCASLWKSHVQFLEGLLKKTKNFMGDRKYSCGGGHWGRGRTQSENTQTSGAESGESRQKNLISKDSSVGGKGSKDGKGKTAAQRSATSDSTPFAVPGGKGTILITQTERRSGAYFLNVEMARNESLIGTISQPRGVRTPLGGEGQAQND